MTEKLAFQEMFGDGRAAYRHQGLVLPFAQGVDGPGHQFLTGTALSPDDHRIIGGAMAWILSNRRRMGGD